MTRRSISVGKPPEGPGLTTLMAPMLGLASFWGG
jgi:hypothetical protein